MWRIFNLINDESRLSPYWIVHEYYAKGELDALRNQVLPSTGFLYQFNNPAYFNTALPLADYKWIVNFRDPRDRLCNSFNWFYNHPASPTETLEEAKVRIDQLDALGIDNWVLRGSGTQYYDSILQVLRQSPAENVHVLTYARLCLDFDGFITGACSALGVDCTSEIRAKLEPERSETIQSNPKWIGHTLQGGDISPGRYKRELRPETIDLMNTRLESVLRAFAKYDPDFAETYLEGLN